MKLIVALAPVSSLVTLLLLVGSPPAGICQTNPDQILLKDYRPHSIFKIPETRIEKARYRAIDVHSHDYGPTAAEVDRWVQTMDAVGVEKTIILSGSTGKRFDELLARYRKYPSRFEVWCGFDYTGFDQPGFGPKALAELERCYKAGATGVGELGDKGRGLGATTNAVGMHIDDPRMSALIDKCGELGMPINIHVAEDKWMYEAMDATNDGLMNAWKWRVGHTPDVMQHDQLVDSLERAVHQHPRTTFIACHFANCCSDLNRLGRMLDQNPNLYADMGARFSEIAAQFFNRYQDRLLYGTDLDPQPEMYRACFRLLETADEHFYTPYFAKYHWPMHAFALPDGVLKKIYRENALRVVLREGGSK
jgi:uncharacterized protein